MAVIIPTGWERFGSDMQGMSSSILAGMKIKADKDAAEEAAASDPMKLILARLVEKDLLGGKQPDVTGTQPNAQQIQETIGQPVPSIQGAGGNLPVDVISQLRGKQAAPPVTPQPGMGLTKITSSGPTFEPDLMDKANVEIWKDWQKESGSNERSLAENYGALKGVNQMLISTWKAAAIEKRDKGIPQGLASKIMAGTVDILELKGYPHTKAYVGAKIESAMNAVKIISGGSRIPRDIFKAIMSSYPTDTGIKEDAYAKLRQSVHSSTARTVSRAFEPKELDMINKDFESLWNNTPPAKLPENISLETQTKNFQLPDGRTLYNVPVAELPKLINDFEWVEEVK